MKSPVRKRLGESRNTIPAITFATIVVEENSDNTPRVKIH